MENMNMRTNFDFSPYRRSTIGFDRLFDLLENSTRVDGGDGYPPFDIERRDENSYRISLAVAGFRPDELDVTSHNNLLVISGKKSEDRERTFLHRGIATRAFERRFELADHVHVSNASLDNGLLTVDLVREIPEEKKPRKIAIGNSNGAQVEGTAKAVEGKGAGQQDLAA
jgi:molecular chaperone IbpA